MKSVTHQYLNHISNRQIRENVGKLKKEKEDIWFTPLTKAITRTEN